MIEDCKMIVTLVWNPQGFYLVEALSKCQKFNTGYSLDIILQTFWRIAQLSLAQVSSFMRTMQDLTLLKRLSGFAGKIS
jgi:hypothetical protein